MKKRIGRRLVSLLLTFVTVLTMLPAMTLPALAATSGPVTGLADENIGLSFTGGVDNAWKAGGKQIEGHARSKPPKWFWESQTDYTSTLTITNKKTTTATLSFDYVATLSSGTIRVDSKTVQQNGTDSFSKELAPNGTATVYIKSGSTSDDTKITMTNVTLVSADTTATVTFQPAENGSYTVDGKTITEEYTNAQSSSIAYKVDATPADGYRFKGWYDVNTGTCINTNATTALSFDSDCTITARFRSKDLALFETGGQLFDDLNEAVAYAQANSQNKITLASDGKITGTYTIPSGVTLLIPFDEAETLYTDKPESIEKYETPRAFRKLTMAPGSSITVDGAISVGGKHCHTMGSLGPSGPYGQIDMAAGSTITLRNGANLYAWGYITGDGQITAEFGATVYEYFQVRDWRGGTATSDMLGKKQKVFPLSQYYVQNIEAALTIQAGAAERTYISISVKVLFIDTVKTATIDFIGSTNSLFRLGNGGTLTKKYDSKTDRTTYTTTGSASLDSLALGISGYNIDSKDYVLPVNSNMTLNILSGSVAMNCDAALLPGAQINIAKDAELNIVSGKSLYVYDYNIETGEWGPYCINNKEFVPVLYSPTKTGTRTLTDAKIDVNGTLTAAGSVYTTQSGANICSSEGTGRFIQTGAPGTGSNTYQCTQANKDITYVSIPITPAKLKNADGKYTETKDAVANDTFIYCKCQDCGNGTWVKDVAAIINNGTQGDTYSTLEAAVNAYSPDSNTAPTNYIKLLHNTTEKPISVNNKSLRLDLNGRTVTGDISVTSGYKLYGMDNSSKEYIAPSGKIVGTVTGTVAPTYQTPPTVDGEYDRYVAIPGTEENGTLNLSFHHFNISVTGYRFELAAPQCALFFIGKFQGDKAAKDYLTSLGFTLKGEDGRPLGEDNYELPADKDIPPEAEPGDSPVVRSGDAFLFEVYLKRSFEKDKPAAYTEKIIATAQAMFKNNETQDSEPKKWSFKDAWTETDGLKDLTPKQQEILKKFLDELGIKQ
jgi:hypothetical protein